MYIRYVFTNKDILKKILKKNGYNEIEKLYLSL